MPLRRRRRARGPSPSCLQGSPSDPGRVGTWDTHTLILQDRGGRRAAGGADAASPQCQLTADPGGHLGVPVGRGPARRPSGARGGAERLYLAGTHVPIMVTGQVEAAGRAGASKHTGTRLGSHEPRSGVKSSRTPHPRPPAGQPASQPASQPAGLGVRTRGGRAARGLLGVVVLTRGLASRRSPPAAGRPPVANRPSGPRPGKRTSPGGSPFGRSVDVSPSNREGYLWKLGAALATGLPSSRPAPPSTPFT